MMMMELLLMMNVLDVYLDLVQYKLNDVWDLLMDFLEMGQRVQVYEIELMMRSNCFGKLMQVHKEFYWIYLQYLYQHHEIVKHEHKLPKK